MANPIRVVIADDHPVVRFGIRGLLERALDIEVIGEASNGKEALDLVNQTVPDVLVLDMELPDMTGGDVARRLLQAGKAVKILVLSAHDDPYVIHELLEYGVMGYLLKEEAPQLIVDAVRGIANGEQGWVSRSIAAHMVSWVRGDEEGPIRFTSRELEVLRFVAKGKTNQNIGALLDISEKTVEKYLYAVFQKLAVSTRTEAAVYAARKRLFSF